ncbi:MAG: hypothetical protein L6437_08800 [Kiritimatiellae bacterium]|nr:hypothetical protein [Verrucomicrobiota bacterium]MBU4285496.1 hypothetical protein [Verrucomicrobiota bacterium]MBU4366869.1 hypothetical protein [Verrucomicrobiota bacterium]MCG2660328.1 hypothetical protein [Kiritimatiellia bacterium]
MNSKLSKILGVAIVVVCTVMAFHTVSAQAPAAAPAEAPAVAAPAVKPAITSALELRKTGIISVVKDASGKVIGLKLIVNSYDIPLDEGSKPLESMDGQKVRVTGTFSNEGGMRRFYVKSVEPVATEGAPAKPAEAAPAK